MTVRVHIPAGFAKAPLTERLRYFADVMRGMPQPNPQMVADLEEAATEIELGQTTRLTYRGRELRR